ncbi:MULTISPECIES: N-acetylmannosamine kinase [Buttiauxella]|uniref:N-acetylmannosamine kinase n=1 Tax=Buttiauxella TaxID=82976 RepID=UPI00125EC386|nr:N-acetylmannosamine kinase [Buttiauxella massiliensis]MRT12733.1 ROK family protein [Enterobacteriaceae bacterium RIT711]
MNTLAIDIGGTKLAAALINSQHEISLRSEIPTPANAEPQALERALAQLVAAYEGKAQRVAIASTGIIDNGILTALNPDNLGGLNHFPLQATVERLTGLPCAVLNDAQAAAWAEYCHLSDQFKHVTFITVSTGVGGGIVINGELLTGPHAFAGHIGHTQADPNGPMCGCGRVGCVEAIASGRGIAAGAQHDLLGKNAREIFVLAQDGNEQAQQLFARSAQAICQLIANLKALLDTECIVLGGSVGLAPGYRLQVEKQLATLPAAFHVPVYSAHYQHDAGLMGAALWSEYHAV